MCHCIFKKDKKDWMWNYKSIRFIPGNFLSMNSFSKLNFTISLFIAKN